jgi:hypothetical protein
MLTLDRFQIVPVLREVTDDGRTVGEKLMFTQSDEPFTVFGLEGLAEFVEHWPAFLAQQQPHAEAPLPPAPAMAVPRGKPRARRAPAKARQR